MIDARSLIEKHRGKGVLVDTNLLVLLLVGQVNPDRIHNFKRTQDFGIQDFHVLTRLVAWFGAPLVATPHVLTEVSNLTDLSGAERSAVRALFKSTVETVREEHDFARRLVEHPLFERFGLGDASIVPCARGILLF